MLLVFSLQVAKEGTREIWIGVEMRSAVEAVRNDGWRFILKKNRGFSISVNRLSKIC